MLGGSSSLNLMIYVRGNKRDYDHWVEMGNSNWNYAKNLKYFKKSEANQNASLVQYRNGYYHSAKGLLKVSNYGLPSPFTSIFSNAGMERGYEFIYDINADKTLGYLNQQGTIYHGRRQSTAKAFLITAANRSNLHIIKNAFVEQILIDDNKRAYGVKFKYNGTTKMRAYARREVILSAGAIMSPVLLMLSGIGPKHHLLQNGIPVKSDLAVGKNLMDHPYTIIFFKFPGTTTPPNLDDAYNFFVHNTGPLTSVGIAQLNAFINVKNDSIYPDCQLQFFYYTVNATNLVNYIALRRFKKNIADTLLSINKDHNIGAILVTLLQPKSRGRIFLKGTCAHNKPLITPNYYSDKEDLNAMIRAIKNQILNLNTKSYRENGAELVRMPLDECDQHKYLSDDYWQCYISYFTGTLYHPCGTSKMGPITDPDSVVDQRLRVRHIRSLRQIDAGTYVSFFFYFLNFIVEFSSL